MNIKKAKLPLTMAIVSFLLFIGVYIMVTRFSIIPYYVRGLVFAVPFICFSIITGLNIKGKLRIVPANIITGILVISLTVVMFFQLIHLMVDAGTTSVTDIDKFERVLRLKNHGENMRISHFPKEIPVNTQNIEFFYSPAFLQGGEHMFLKYEISSQYIEQLAEEYSSIAQWSGPSDNLTIQNYGIDDRSFYFIGYDQLPEGFTVYVLDSEPYKTGDWNHGYSYGLAVSTSQGIVIYFSLTW